jgi:hypothetical protein
MVGSCFWTKKLHNLSWGIGKLCHLLIHRNALNLCQNQIIMWRKTTLRFFLKVIEYFNYCSEKLTPIK